MMLYYAKTGSFVFTSILPANASWPEYLILAGFALNAAVLPLHAWLPDAYPEATVEGAVFICAFTTKTAVYVLARGFSGFEILAIMGTAMTVYGVCYAVIENDIRRVLAYHIISQVGYMVAGVGIGTEMAVNGACGPRLRPHPVQGAPLHGRGRGPVRDGHGQAHAAWAGCTSTCRSR